MGNSSCQCCQEPFQNQVVSQHSTNILPIRIPKLEPPIEQHLKQFRPFEKELPQRPTVRRLGEDIFQGKVTFKGRPVGYGTIYRKDGCVFVGQFVNGVPHGKGHFVATNGSYYHGLFNQNKAEDQNGLFVSENFEYKGGFKNNVFEGLGEETALQYKFAGQYKNGSKVYGKLTWNQEQEGETTYQGPFNEQELFSGSGYLQNSKGVYKGGFFNGLKDGKGVFKYKIGIEYDGEYRNGFKNGRGIIYAKDKTVSYDGEFLDGLPHGRGIIPNEKGKKVQRIWIHGVDRRVLQDYEEQSEEKK